MPAAVLRGHCHPAPDHGLPQFTVRVKETTITNYNLTHRDPERLEGKERNKVYGRRVTDRGKHVQHTSGKGLASEVDTELLKLSSEKARDSVNKEQKI